MIKVNSISIKWAQYFVCWGFRPDPSTTFWVIVRRNKRAKWKWPIIEDISCPENMGLTKLLYCIARSPCWNYYRLLAALQIPVP